MSGARNLFCKNCDLKCLLESFYEEIINVIENESKPYIWAESMPPIPMLDITKKIKTTVIHYFIEKLSVGINDIESCFRMLSEILVLTCNYEHVLYEYYSNNWRLYY
jgi:hypothetical protein